LRNKILESVKEMRTVHKALTEKVLSSKVRIQLKRKRGGVYDGYFLTYYISED